MRELRKVCSLSYKEAAEAVAGWTGEIMYRRGVWNAYATEEKGRALERIKSSGYGVDVSVDDAGKIMYISQPVASDMW